MTDLWDKNLQLKGKSKVIEISAICYRKMCSPFLTTIDLERHPHLQWLDIAHQNLIDQSTDLASNIYVLIGSDHYYDIGTGDVQRFDGSPVAVNSKFGWMVWGSAFAKTAPGDGNVTQLTVQKPDSTVLSEVMIDELTNALRTQISWYLKTWIIARNGIFTTSKIQRQSWTLSGKSSVERTLPAQFSCLTRLRQLPSRLKADRELLKQYDNVILEQVKSNKVEKVSEL